MNDHAGRKFACGREMGNNEFSWSGLSRIPLIPLYFISSISLCKCVPSSVLSMHDPISFKSHFIL